MGRKALPIAEASAIGQEGQVAIPESTGVLWAAFQTATPATDGVNPTIHIILHSRGRVKTFLAPGHLRPPPPLSGPQELEVTGHEHGVEPIERP
jgi:hypothetical protein